MKLIIANENFERIGIIENAEVIWTSRYYKTGDFQIVMSASKDNLFYIDQGLYVIREEDEDNIGVIEDFNITNTPTEGDRITVTGRFASGYYLSGRVISQQTQLSGNFQNSIRNLVNLNIINPTDNNRKIDFIKLGEKDTSITETLEMQTTGDNLLTKVEETSESVGVGFKMPLRKRFIGSEQQINLEFEMYKGIDRSYAQNENPWIIFSDEYDNLKECEYNKITSNIINFAYVAGEGEGLDRKIVGSYCNEEEPIGPYRREIWVDQRNISSNNDDITEEELTNQMKEEGRENLIGISEAFAGDVVNEGYKYGKPENGGEFYLGDIVSIQKKSWNNLYINARIVEVIESEDQNGKVMVFTFGI